MNNMGMIYTIFFKSPLTTNCTRLLHLTMTNASYSWALRPNASLIALQDGFQARDGRNQFGDLDMPGDFMHYCADALNKQHGCLRGGAKQPNSALIGRSRGSGADAA